jgi:sRNA-binding protein
MTSLHPRTILTRGVSTGLRLGRGTADRVVTVAGPPLGRLTDTLVSRLRRQEPSAPATFTPSRRAQEVRGPNEAAEPASAAPTGPTPSSVARNIAPQRPAAKPARPRKPKSVPGAKLPPPRPSAT